VGPGQNKEGENITPTDLAYRRYWLICHATSWNIVPIRCLPRHIRRVRCYGGSMYGGHNGRLSHEGGWKVVWLPLCQEGVGSENRQLSDTDV